MDNKVLRIVILGIVVVLAAFFIIPTTAYPEDITIKSAVAVVVKEAGKIEGSYELDETGCSSLSEQLKGGKCVFSLVSERRLSSMAWTKISFYADRNGSGKYELSTIYITEDRIYMFREGGLLGNTLTGADADKLIEAAGHHE